jgi:hypothetical protein
MSQACSSPVAISSTFRPCGAGAFDGAVPPGSGLEQAATISTETATSARMS